MKLKVSGLPLGEVQLAHTHSQKTRATDLFCFKCWVCPGLAASWWGLLGKQLLIVSHTVGTEEAVEYSPASEQA